MKTLTSSINASIENGYDDKETDRHYGPWLHDEMYDISKHAYSALIESQSPIKKSPKISIMPSTLPNNVGIWTEDTINSARLTQRINKPIKHSNDTDIINLTTEFIELFLDLHDKREIPVRQEVHLLGPKILDATPQEAPNRDRLEIGLPWSVISAFLHKRYNISLSHEIKNLFSLVLDLCNDLGIAVPITCIRDGIVFRAYRHGEDVKFFDGELALAFEAAKGLLKSTNSASIPHLVLEKLLVLLIKIGAGRKFLEPLYGTSGVDGIARIGFNLKGAVPVLIKGPKDRADRNIWLSQYMVERQILRFNENGQYILGTPIEGNYLVPNAPEEAYELGNILGMLLKSATDTPRKDAPLDDKALIIISTCWPPRHAAAALQVELDIFRRWYEDGGGQTLKKTNWDDPKSIHRSLEFLIRSKGHEAIHSAKLKFIGYKTNQYIKIIDSCAQFLEKNLPIDLPARTWRSYWNSLKTLEAAGEKGRFDPLIDDAASFCWEIATCLSAIEIAFRARMTMLLSKDKDTELKKAFNKLWLYDKEMLSTRLEQPTIVAKLVQRFKDIETNRCGIFDHQKAFNSTQSIIENRIIKVAGFVETIDPVIEEFGRLYGHHNYKYMLWYDIIDSTATILGRTGKDVEIYRKRIKSFKQLLNRRFHSVTITARMKSCEIYCWNGDRSSTNDMKHVFFSGKFARSYLENVLDMLLDAAKAFSDVALRIYIVPCNFAGTSAYRREFDTEIMGERFWEHWSRIHVAGSMIEGGYDKNKSFLLIATDEFIKSFRLPYKIKWLGVKEDSLTSEIELLTKTTRVRYGNIIK